MKEKKNLFEIVNHLNIGVALITEPTQIAKLCQLNLRAGQKAKASTAYTIANQYLTTGIHLLRAQLLANPIFTGPKPIRNSPPKQPYSAATLQEWNSGLKLFSTTPPPC